MAILARRDEARSLLLGSALAATIGLCFFTLLFLLQSSSVSCAPDTAQPPGQRNSPDSLSEMLVEAKHNLGIWLDYVHSTSDPEDEMWDDNEEVQDDLDSFEDDNQSLQQRNKFEPVRTIVVAKDGSGDFTTIKAAVADIPKHNKERVLIKIKAGIYREKLTIAKHKRYITMEGELPYNDELEIGTVITYNSTAADLDQFGVPLKTFGSATFAVNANYFIAKNIAFQNSAPKPEPGAVGGQAVATRVSADKVAFYGCRFYGDQDTLYDHKGRHFFKDCYVEGTVDFVFGNGRSLYESCHLNALSNNGAPGTLTAQKRNTSSLDTGFSFLRSLVTGYGSVYLGRAWGNDSRVVFADTYMTKVVLPDGWNDWGIPAREKSVFYAEFNCTGPGANATERVDWAQQLTFEQARPFLSIGYINGKKWLQNPKSLKKEERSAMVVVEELAESPRTGRHLLTAPFHLSSMEQEALAAEVTAETQELRGPTCNCTFHARHSMDVSAPS